jgi:hypothetical protein
MIDSFRMRDASSVFPGACVRCGEFQFDVNTLLAGRGGTDVGCNWHVNGMSDLPRVQRANVLVHGMSMECQWNVWSIPAPERGRNMSVSWQWDASGMSSNGL